MLGVCDCTIALVNVRNGLIYEHLLEVLRVGGGHCQTAACVAGTVYEVVVHHYDHRLYLALGYHIVRNDGCESAVHPFLLHLSCAVLEVENGIALAVVGLVVGGSVDEHPAPTLVHVTVEIVLANLSVRHVAHQVIVVTGGGNLYVSCPSVAVDYL